MIKKMQLGIICAMELEAEGYISRMSEKETVTVGGVRFYYGRLCEKETVISVCGIGKVFAAICAQTMILSFAPEYIINTGVAGTLTEDVGIGDMVIATDVVQHDMDTSAIGDPVGLISGINVISIPCSKKIADLIGATAEKLQIPYIYGRIASGDKFISKSEEKERIKKIFDASACEMEGGAIGQVCYVNKVDFCVIRAISDGGDENATLDYPKFAREAAKKAVDVLCSIIPFI